MALSERDISIIVQNAGTTAGAVVSALLESGQVVLGGEDQPADIAALVGQVRRALVQDAIALTGELAPDEPVYPQQADEGAVVRAFPKAQPVGDGKSCPKCGGDMWDNRRDKREGRANPKAPDFKCKNRDECDGVIWPPRQ